MNNRDYIKDRLTMLQTLLTKFIDLSHIDTNDVVVSVPSLLSIVTDVEIDINKEKQFHMLSVVSEAKEISLICYYLLKRKPILITNSSTEDDNLINEKFCLYLILGLVEDKKLLDAFNSKYIRFVLYTFYRGELSKEALYLYVHTLTTIGTGAQE